MLKELLKHNLQFVLNFANKNKIKEKDEAAEKWRSNLSVRKHLFAWISRINIICAKVWNFQMKYLQILTENEGRASLACEENVANVF